MKKYIISIFIIIIFKSLAISQAVYEDEKYVAETDPLVIEKLDEWQDLKFGLLMHWGAYSQWGIVESWSICPEEYGWCERKAGSHPDNYVKYVEEYEELQTTFNPVKFNPDRWAKAAKNSGMKYIVFTTKHHDGFCMFDSKYTDYKITDPNCPFSTNPRSNITKEIFDAFRKEGLWTGAYFSKPDWHSPFYWDPYYPPRDRNVNYEPEANLEKWNKFTEFTHNQILELLTDYGKVDILWLDGGWVAKEPKEKINEWYKSQLKNNENGYLKHRIVNQDIKMDQLVQKARLKQPGLIVVDRAVYGKNQNYLTPENRVPNKPLPYPWESCIISGGGWSHTKDAKYMSGREGIQLLVDIVAKGGNLLLNIAPTPDGEWQEGAYKLLEEIGDWMKVNNEAIYNSKVIKPYKEDNICMTLGTKGERYFLYLCENNEVKIPKEIVINTFVPQNKISINILGNETPLSWEETNSGIIVKIPESIQNNPPCKYVWTIKVTSIK